MSSWEAAHETAILRRARGFFQKGTARGVLLGLKSGLELAAVQSEGLRLLGRLAAGSTEVRHEIGRRGGIAAILGALHSHAAAADVQEWGLYALANLADADVDNQHTLAGHGGIEAMCAAMAAYPGLPHVQECGCAALGSVAADHAANQRAVATKGGIGAVVAALHSQLDGVMPASPAVVEKACLALALLAAENPTNQTMIAQDAGGVRAIVESMRQHGQGESPSGRVSPPLAAGGSSSSGGCNPNTCNQAPLKEACLALGNLAAQHQLNQRVILAASGVEVVLGALKHHEDPPASTELQERGWYLLYWLVDDEGATARIKRWGGRELAVRMRVFTALSACLCGVVPQLLVMYQARHPGLHVHTG